MTGDPLVEIAFGTTPDGGPRALRVTADGRVELRDDRDAEGGGRVTPRWREQWRLTAEEAARLRDAVAAADVPPLDARYGPDPADSRAREVVFRLRTPERIARVSVAGWPEAAPERLRDLYRLVYTVHEDPDERSVWRMWTGSRLVERTVEGTPEDDPRLAAIAHAVYRGGSGAPDARFEPPPDGTPILEIRWGGEGGEVTRVHPDGRQEVERDGAVEALAPLEPGALGALQDALRRV